MRQLLMAGGLAATTLLAGAADAQPAAQFPNKPVRVVLVRQWESIPPPKFKPGTFEMKSFQRMPKNFDNLKYSFRFKYYDVVPGDLP